jgi:hypothetical protein
MISIKCKDCTAYAVGDASLSTCSTLVFSVGRTCTVQSLMGAQYELKTSYVAANVQSTLCSANRTLLPLRSCCSSAAAGAATALLLLLLLCRCWCWCCCWVLASVLTHRSGRRRVSRGLPSAMPHSWTQSRRQGWSYRPASATRVTAWEVLQQGYLDQRRQQQQMGLEL